MLKKYLVERDRPGSGRRSREELQATAENSLKALAAVGPGIQWIESYIAEGKSYCVYYAESEDLVRQVSEKAGLPITKISEIYSMLDPVYRA